MTPLPEPTQAEREEAGRLVAAAYYNDPHPDLVALMRSTIEIGGAPERKRMVNAVADAIARQRTDAALRYLTGPCAFEEDHAREIIEQVRGGEGWEETVRAILGMGR